MTVTLTQVTVQASNTASRHFASRSCSEALQWWRRWVHLQQRASLTQVKANAHKLGSAWSQWRELHTERMMEKEAARHHSTALVQRGRRALATSLMRGRQRRLANSFAHTRTLSGVLRGWRQLLVARRHIQSTLEHIGGRAQQKCLRWKKLFVLRQWHSALVIVQEKEGIVQNEHRLLSNTISVTLEHHNRYSWTP
jgi:hypothetical protein